MKSNLMAAAVGRSFLAACATAMSWPTATVAGMLSLASSTLGRLSSAAAVVGTADDDTVDGTTKKRFSCTGTSVDCRRTIISRVCENRPPLSCAAP